MSQTDTNLQTCGRICCARYHVVLGQPLDKAGYEMAQLLQLLAAEVLHLRGDNEGSGGQHGLAGVDIEAVIYEH